jgi:UDP-N-acetylglucosamine 2-epimerase (non-hydrolysing)
MSDSFFADLGIPPPDHHLEVGSGSHAVQTAEVMKRFEPVLESVQPQAVLVVGDVNSTIACALVAAKRGVRVIHVEAGLRSYDRSMPEEINRVLTDQISDLLFTTEKSALANLVREGIDAARVEFVGNVMIDTLHRNLERAVPASRTLGTALAEYAVLTLHRPSNVDDRDTLAALLDVIGEINRACRWWCRCIRARAAISRSSASPRSSTACASCRRSAIWKCSA